MSLWESNRPYQIYFSGTFAQARSSWLILASAADAGTQRGAFTHPLLGPGQEALATDYLWWGPRDAGRVVVLLSGTHGIEGYAGSALQRFLLDGLLQGAVGVPPNTAILFVHALTPWGMAWYRRCDENGIDLNRHFVDFQQPPDNPGFARILPCLEIDDASVRRQALLGLAKEMGQSAYEQAVSGGQYQYPQAPFYGGSQPNHGRRVIESLIEEHQLAPRDLLVIDIHTGLGPWSCAELICDHPTGSAATQVAQKTFGAGVTFPEMGTSSSVPKQGLLDYAWHGLMNDSSCFLTLEFGTYSTQDLFDCVIEDHRLWAETAPQPPSGEAWVGVRQAMLEHFFPADSDWRQLIFVRGLQVLRRALVHA